MNSIRIFIGLLFWFGMVWLCSDAAAFETLTHPDGYDTHAYGVDGTTIVGFVGYKVISDTGYTDVPQHAFLYDTTTGTWTTLDHPNAINSYTRGDAIDGTKMAGFYRDRRGPVHGFVYDITRDPYDPASWTTVNYGGGSAANNTFLYGIDGDYLTGRYINSEGMEVGFLYDGQGTWTTLSYPGAYKTRAYGIDVSEAKVTGFYQDTTGAHGYLYDMSKSPDDPSAWTSFDNPESHWTFAYGIDGTHVVGRYVASSGEEIGFIYDYSTTTWTRVDYSNTRTYVCGIEGQTIVGLYEDETGKVHGFQSAMAAPPPSVTSFMINNGASRTVSTIVTLNNTATNDPTEYMASESSVFAGAQWLPYAPAPSFTLSPTLGTKRVYFKVRNDEGESARVRDAISLVTGPEIAVSQAGTLIPDNSGSFDFGSVPIRTTVQVTFTIQNLGDSNLNLTGSPRVSLTGPNAADFRVFTQPGTPIRASLSTTFVIAFRSGAHGVRSASVSIANDDGDENPYNFAITGTGS
ncbi:MAG TPA: choice-of-anchor D domain-containing protein [Thermodesulfobacteriota bacterium]|nr:choice-of-anchor D domain-containing protein [Thermodesulfobacteriota bacterium]